MLDNEVTQKKIRNNAKKKKQMLKKTEE